MSTLVLYGSDVADGTLTTASDMATVTGGTETSKVTTYASGSGNFGEVFSQGSASGVAVSAIPATPTGHGWVYSPGAGTWPAQFWSAVFNLANVGANGAWTLRFFKRSSGGTYTSIGTISGPNTSSAKTAVAFPSTSMPSVTFLATDVLYIDLWYQDATGAASDTATVYLSTSASAGVANDVQITITTVATLHVYGTSVASTTLTTAGKLATTTGGTSTTKATRLGKLTGWGEVWALGTITTWPAGVPEPAPSGNGWLLDATTLEGQDLLAGTFTPIVTLNVSSGVATADIHLRVYDRSSAGVYTLILDLVKTGASITTTATAFSLTTALASQKSFVTGDKLYLDVLLNVGTNTSASTTSTVSVGLSSVATGGLANKVDLNTQGYQATPSGNIIVGLVQAQLLISIASQGWSRANYTESIAHRAQSRAKFLTSIGSKVAGRARLLLSIGQKASSRAKFLVSKASKGLARARFTASIAQKGRGRSRFSISSTLRGLAESTFKISSAGHAITAYIRSRYSTSIRQTQAQRSKFFTRFSQAGVVRGLFKVAIKSNAQTRSRFLLSLAQRGLSRSRYLLAIVQRGSGRSRFLSAAKQSANSRSRFIEAAAQKAQVRSRFLTSIKQAASVRSRYLISKALKALAESTFKIAVGAGHLITAYIQTRYKVAIRQAQGQRSRFQIRHPSISQARSTFKTAFRSAAQGRSRFLVALRLVGKSRSKFVIRIFQVSQTRSVFKSAAKVSFQARSRFLIRFALFVQSRARFLLAFRLVGKSRSRSLISITQAAYTRARFLVNATVIIRPIASITHNVVQSLNLTEQIKPLLVLVENVWSVLQTAWKTLSSLNLSSVQLQSLTITHQGIAMPAPNSTILSTITVTDVSGAAVSNAGAVSVVVHFPDGTTTTYSLGSGITNIGSGQYQAKYNTKSPGTIRELWSIVAADGVTLASEQFEVGVGY